MNDSKWLWLRNDQLTATILILLINTLFLTNDILFLSSHFIFDFVHLCLWIDNYREHVISRRWRRHLLLPTTLANRWVIQRAFLVTDHRVFNGPFGRSLCLFARSLAPQRSASLRSLAPFMGLLTHFAHSLVGQLKFFNMCSHCNWVSKEHLH